MDQGRSSKAQQNLMKKREADEAESCGEMCSPMKEQESLEMPRPALSQRKRQIEKILEYNSPKGLFEARTREI